MPSASDQLPIQTRALGRVQITFSSGQNKTKSSVLIVPVGDVIQEIKASTPKKIIDLYDTNHA
jgi:hypothetical protein